MTEFKAGQRVRITVEGTVRAGYTDPSDAFGIEVDDSEDNWVYFESLPEGSVKIIEQALPTEDGWYESERYPVRDGSWHPYRRKMGEWYGSSGKRLEVDYMRKLIPLYRLGRVE